MSIFGPNRKKEGVTKEYVDRLVRRRGRVRVPDPIDETDATNKRYVDGTTVSRVGDTMLGTLDMEGHPIIGLPNHMPTEPNSAVSLNVLRRIVPKPFITIWAETRGGLGEGNFEWSFGAIGTTPGGRHASFGYPMLRNGRILSMGLSCERHSGTIGVDIAVDGVVTRGYDIEKDNTEVTKTKTFARPLNVSAGQSINFRSKNDNNSVRIVVVSLLIELVI